MNASVAVQPTQSGWGRKLAWGAGALVAGAVVPQVLLPALLWLGMGVTAATRLDNYAFALAACMALYVAVIHVSIRIIGARTDIPRFVWLALAAWPVGWFLIYFVGGEAVAFEPAPVVPALFGLAVAFFTLGKHRWAHAE